MSRWHSILCYVRNDDVKLHVVRLRVNRFNSRWFKCDTDREWPGHDAREQAVEISTPVAEAKAFVIETNAWNQQTLGLQDAAVRRHGYA